MKAIVIGAGPSGLASAACLTREGVEVEILERSDRIGMSWHGHYERLHLHTVRGRSGLPYRAMPKSYGRYPSRAEMIAYLKDYAAAFGLAPRFGCSVEAVRPVERGWAVAHSGGEDRAEVVVFATGLNGVPNRPDWPGLEAFGGTVLHSSDYATADRFAGQRVLVVGFGNSGGDIALDLVEAGAAVTVSVRSAVNILPKELFGIPITSMGGLRKVLPYKLADALTAPVFRAKIGRPEDYGMRSADKGPAAQVIEDGQVPLIDVGALPAIKAGKIGVAPGVERFEPGAVVFEGDARREFDAVILATGYRVDLRSVLGEVPGALDAEGRPLVSGAPAAVSGLYFCSYKASADGQLRQSGIEARAIAAEVLKAV